MRPRRIPIADLLPFLALLLLPTLLLWRVVFAGDVFLPADLLRDIAPWRDESHLVPWNPLMWDGMAEFYPWRLFAAQSLRAGWLPLWNPHQLCGTPFVANSQSAVFYPPNLLFCLLPVARAFGVSAGLHLALTGLFLYGFLRSGAFGLSPPAALVGAVAWQMSTWQVAWLALPTFLCVSCWLPLALWLTWRAIAPPAPDSGGEDPPAPGPRGAGRWASLGVSLGLMLLAGHLQIALYCVGLTCAYALFLLSGSPGIGGGGGRLAGILLALGLMLGLAAPQLLPAIELAKASHRAGAPVNWQGYQNYTALAVPALSLVTLWLPGFFGSPTEGTYWGPMSNGGPSGYTENACYIGILALGLAFLGVAATWRQRRPTRFFTLAALISLLMALGTPLDALPYFGLPGFAQSGSPGRVLVVWTLCAAILAGAGAERLVRGPAHGGRTALGAGGAFALAFLLALGGTIAWITRNGSPSVLQINMARVGDLWRVPVGILLGAAALLWLRRRGTLSSPMLGLCLATLAATDLLAVNGGFSRTAAPDQVYPVTPGIALLQRTAGADRILALNRGWSIEGGRPPPTVFPPNAATVYGLNDVAGYDSLLTRRSFQFVATLDGGRGPAPPENGNLVFTSEYDSPQAHAAAARYVVSRRRLTDPALRLVAQDAEMFVYENPRALPRAQTMGGAQAALLQDLAPTRLAITGGAGDSVVVADQWYPGWRAWLNGRPAEVGIEEGMFRRVALHPGDAPAGKDARVEMRYLPATFRTGLYGFCLALGVVFGVTAARLGGRGGG
ncbi:MAG: hypothetical protein JO250_13605 [Armatimonadetes bacterium]|nr:hypothetical protein [Armatimonadota bacterium]